MAEGELFPLLQLSLQPLDENETEILAKQVLRDRELPEELIGLLDNR